VRRARESLARIAAVARKELYHLRRDRLTGGMIGGIPIMMTIIFGLAINQDVRHLRAGVADLAGTQRARELALDAQATQVIDLVRTAASAEELERLLVRGDIVVGILIPPDFERRVATRERAPAQLLVDGGDPVVLGSARGLAALPVRAPVAAAAAAAGAPPATFELRAYFNPERRSPVFIVPGLCGVILTLTMVLFTSAAIVRERERGNLEMLIATPIRTPELMIGKVLPYVAIGYVQITIILALAFFFFRVPIRGSLVDCYVGAGAFIAAMLSLGLIFSTVAQSQFQAFQMAFVSFVPQIILSGFMFPFDGMPRPFQWLSELLPLTHFLRIIRGVLLRGAGLGELWPDVWPLLAMFAGLMTLSILRFRKRLD
jgi:ABC-2 type transport system permease protein